MGTNRFLIADPLKTTERLLLKGQKAHDNFFFHPPGGLLATDIKNAVGKRPGQVDFLHV
jgi:hypothetical protein